MKEELDINAITAKFIQNNLEKFVEISSGVFTYGADKLRLHLRRTYRNYFSVILEKYSKAKSFLLRGEPVPLYRFYVPLDIRTRNKLIISPTLAEIRNVSNYSIIMGSAGCGKSMMMRHLLLNSVLNQNIVPVFIELRQFNSTEDDLLGLINHVLSSNKFNLGNDYLKKALEHGHFLFLLDGYDEVVSSRRIQIGKCINEFCRQYGENMVVVSSRPDAELDGWQQFTSMKIEDLSFEQAYKLVQKVPYDEEMRKKFLNDLKSLFEKHKSFLSNPLLLSIMLLTYGQSANIPNKLNVFYNQAYEALFERHDALKCGYKRERLTKLDIQDFGRVFSAFCLQAYDKREFEFDRIQALSYIEKSQRISGIQCVKEDYLKDLIQAVCLLMEDGLHLVYAHRSFQEYFTAKFIADARAEIQAQLVKKYSDSAGRDNVFQLLYEMRPDIVDEYYVIPALDYIIKEVGITKHVSETDF